MLIQPIIRGIAVMLFLGSFLPRTIGQTHLTADSIQHRLKAAAASVPECECIVRPRLMLFPKVCRHCKPFYLALPAQKKRIEVGSPRLGDLPMLVATTSVEVFGEGDSLLLKGTATDEYGEALPGTAILLHDYVLPCKPPRKKIAREGATDASGRFSIIIGRNEARYLRFYSPSYQMVEYDLQKILE